MECIGCIQYLLSVSGYCLGNSGRNGHILIIMGAVICGSRNATSTDRSSSKQSSKFLGQKKSEDSTSDSSNLVECSSPTNSTEKERHVDKCDDHYCISPQIETKEVRYSGFY